MSSIVAMGLNRSEREVRLLIFWKMYGERNCMEHFQRDIALNEYPETRIEVGISMCTISKVMSNLGRIRMQDL